MKTKMNLLIETDIAKRLKEYCPKKKGPTQSWVVNCALKEWLDKNQKKA